MVLTVWLELLEGTGSMVEEEIVALLRMVLPHVKLEGTVNERIMLRDCPLLKLKILQMILEPFWKQLLVDPDGLN